MARDYVYGVDEVRRAFASVLDSSRLDCLAANLAVAGALCEAFALGYRCADENEHGSAACDPWEPNTDGRAAP